VRSHGRRHVGRTRQPFKARSANLFDIDPVEYFHRSSTTTWSARTSPVWRKGSRRAARATIVVRATRARDASLPSPHPGCGAHTPLLHACACAQSLNSLCCSMRLDSTCRLCSTWRPASHDTSDSSETIYDRLLERPHRLAPSSSRVECSPDSRAMGHAATVALACLLACGEGCCGGRSDGWRRPAAGPLAGL
jgi:hypothetical protein